MEVTLSNTLLKLMIGHSTLMSHLAHVCCLLLSALKGRVTRDAIQQNMNFLLTIIDKPEHYRCLLLHRDPFNSAEF